MIEQIINQCGISAEILVDSKEISHDEWLQNRTKGIGGSDIGAIAGLNKWKSPLSVYLDKVGENIPFNGNEHTEFGNWMEPHIREEFPKRFFKKENIEIQVYEFPYFMRNKEHTFMLANIDGVMIHPEYGFGGIEIKTASEMQWREWEGENLPDSYYLQMQHYMAVTGLTYFYIVALVGKKLLWKLVLRDEEVIESIIQIEKVFWNERVVKKNPPPPNGYDCDKDILNYLYPNETKGNIVELHDLEEILKEREQIATQIKELELKKSELEQNIKSEMKDAETAFIGLNKVTWKTVHKKEYMVKATSYRMMRVYKK